MKRGDFVIMNTADAPEAKMVAVLTRHDDVRGIWHALYLWDNRIMRAPYGPRPTLVSDFGQSVEIDGDQYRVVPTGKESVATYEDGVNRRWQDHTGSPWRTICRGAMKAIAARPRIET